MRHGLQCVGGQVEEHLPQGARRCEDRGQVVHQIDLYADPLFGRLRLEQTEGLS